MSYYSLIKQGGEQMKNKTLPVYLLIPIIAALLILPQTVSANPGWDIQVITEQGTTILSYDQLLTLPQTTVYAELYCYGAPVTKGYWTGVKLTDLLSFVGLNPSGGSIDFQAKDGYKVSIPLEMALEPNVIVAYQKDGIPLAETYRLVLPGSNGNLWISLITDISLGTGITAQSQSPSGPTLANQAVVVPGRQTQALAPTVTPTPTPPSQTVTPSNITSLQPVNPNLNQTQTPSIEDIPKGSVDLPVQLLYGAAFAAVMTVVLASFAVIRLRKRKD
jgi:DMSO/TMAO reductase YedYZ molybdopterin-dependent catalytic subunit